MNETMEVFNKGDRDLAYRMFLQDETHNAEVEWTFEKFCEAMIKLIRRHEALKEQEAVCYYQYD